jgi:myo-inositol 2-dehydrogenase/D-chiro-inositol 1-dehydrogenase
MSTLERVRLGVIGCGDHSITSLQPCIPLIPAFDYIASCDLNPDRAALGSRFGAKRHYSDFSRMPAAEELDAVIVVGPAPMHFEAGLACAAAGVHLFVEKPVAPTVAQARQVADVIRAKGTIGMTGTMWRHAPAIRTQKRVIEAPEFGHAVLFQGAHIAPGTHASGPGGAGGGSALWRFMLDQGSHVADCLRFLMGRVQSVASAVSSSAQREHGVFLSALLTFTGGATGTLLLASHATVMSPILTIFGDAGTAVTVRNLTSLRIFPLTDDLSGGYPRVQTSRIWEHGANYRGISRPGYLEELEAFAKALTGEEPPSPSLDDGWRALELCQAIIDAADGPIHLNQAP